ncbi:hypothetical protein OBBRIDRAFT_740951 [Obba rivulosa]|uniref:DDE Tnp4 domain-containing protein n=1 Tax=Obba rivulosa TaxID=1052685 RepID=A0A8E2AMR4_9APHY|nr:hypothetical protein OBBRIDRAFT_740951 [Obba rivulosa]
MTPFKWLPSRILTKKQIRYNYYHSKVHIQIKHAIGLLKEHFQFLYELHI